MENELKMNQKSNTRMNIEINELRGIGIYHRLC
jgi:hypothetical protein